MEDISQFKTYRERNAFLCLKHHGDERQKCKPFERELYFPFAMYVMAFMVSRLWQKGRGVAVLGGFLCGAFFLTVRWLQHASMNVLFVEGVVAAGILIALCLYCRQGLDRGWSRMVSLIGASLLAYAGLAL